MALRAICVGTLIVVEALVAVTASAGTDYVGPRANPEDQIRGFSLFPSWYFDDLLEIGFNTFTGFQATPADKDPKAMKRELLDRILAAECDFVERWELDRDRAAIAKYPRIGKDGKPGPLDNLDVTDPAARALVCSNAVKSLAALGGHPALIGAAVCSESRDSTRPSFTAIFSNAWAKASGGRPVPPEVEEKVGPHFRTIRGFPAGRVIPDDWPLLEFYRWFWREGDGWVPFENEMTDVVDAGLGCRAFTSFSPIVRVPPLWGAEGGKTLCHVHWTYANPLPYAIGYVIAEQQEAARGSGAMIGACVQGICYRNRLAPADKTVADPPTWLAERPNAAYLTPPPDMLVESFWMAFARRLDGISCYGWRSLYDADPYGYPKESRNYQYTNSGTVPALKELFRRVAIPLGPLFRALPERPADVALLESFSATIFAGRGSWGWDGPEFLAGQLATKANLMPRCLYEDDVAKNGIPREVKVVLAPGCDVLTESAVRALKDFQARGGMVVADRHLVPEILPDADIPTVRYYGNATAADIAESFQSAADKLNADITAVRVPFARAGQKDLILHLRSYGSADYLFVVNDRRVAGDYVGQWGKVFEKGVPNAGTVTLRRPAGAVYDLVAHKAVPFVCRDGETSVPVEFATSDGRLLLFATRPLAPLQAVRDGDGLLVRSDDSDVMIPIEIRREGKRPYYAVVRDGFWRSPAGFGPVQAICSLADGSSAVWRARAQRPATDEAVVRHRAWKERRVDLLVPSNRVARPIKRALSQSPTNDHEMRRVSGEKVVDGRFTAPKRPKAAVAELWFGRQRRNFTIELNGREIGDYEELINVHGRDFRLDVTENVRWGGENLLSFKDFNGKPLELPVSFEVFELLH